ncbi:uncharacterized protein LOC141643442 [Silene latifolia]|uniref:uncharacterized protein LOC141643442 n=1 Tax=Silene latifolia TaxID=37657 RepID=UPI003D781FEE
MESSGGDTNHLDADVRLPPRKRLLAVLKKQSASESTSQSSQENTPSPSLSPSIGQSPVSPLSEFDVRLNQLLKSYKNGSNMSPEEIALAAKSAADAAGKAAQAARAAAEEKAAIAAKAVAAAKSALDLVACDETGSRNKHQKKSKSKKHVPVQLFYHEYEPIENCGADEEIARRLHRAMNSSPRISKHSPKKLKISSPCDKSVVSNGTSMRNEDVKFPNGEGKGEVDCEGSNEESYAGEVNEKLSGSSKDDEVEVDSGEAESSHQGLDCLSINGRKRGRNKQKRLPLSIVCSSKDQSNQKEELQLANSLLTLDRTDNSTALHLSLPSVDSVTPMEVAPTWKCQDFKVSECIKQDKLVQS